MKLLHNSLAPGLLLASPRLGDPNFERSVVLLAEHNAEGTLGWVLNGKPLVPVRQLLEEAELVPHNVRLPLTHPYSHLVRVGGPVMPGSAWLLYRQTTALAFEGEHRLGKGIVMAGSRAAVEAVARGDGPDEFQLFLGYAGWSPHQLELEIEAGAWLPTAVDESLLQLEPTTLWETMYARMLGTIPMAFTSTFRGSA